MSGRRGIVDMRHRRGNQVPFEGDGRQHRRIVGRIVAAGMDGSEVWRHHAVRFHHEHDLRAQLTTVEVSSPVATRRSRPRGCKRPISQSTVDRYNSQRSHRRRRHFPSSGSHDQHSLRSDSSSLIDWHDEYAKYRLASNMHEDAGPEADVSTPPSLSPVFAAFVF